MDEKLLYLTKTLSRTKRKDYENYVVNSIWNGVKRPDLLPISQQCIRKKDGKHYFIDLYFPQINVGIECDEQYHESIKNKDKQRELNIFDILNHVNETSSYRLFRIKVTETTSLEKIDKEIENCIIEIKKVISEKIAKGIWNDGWKIIFNNPFEYYSEKEYISLSDNINFKTTKDIYNSIFSKDYKKSPRRGGIDLPNGMRVWTPQLTVDGKERKAGWHNEISLDGTTIIEYSNKSKSENEKRHKTNQYIGQRRIVFTKTRDLVTGIDAYRFVGLFIADHYEKNHALVYKQIDNKYKFR